MTSRTYYRIFSIRPLYPKPLYRKLYVVTTNYLNGDKSGNQHKDLIELILQFQHDKAHLIPPCQSQCQLTHPHSASLFRQKKNYAKEKAYVCIVEKRNMISATVITKILLQSLTNFGIHL